jgi:hypothetical protein
MYHSSESAWKQLPDRVLAAWHLVGKWSLATRISAVFVWLVTSFEEAGSGMALTADGR